MASAQFIIAAIHAFTIVSANLVHLAAWEQICGGEGISMPLFPTVAFLTWFEVFTIQATSTSFIFEKNLVCESRQFLLGVEAARQIIT